MDSEFMPLQHHKVAVQSHGVFMGDYYVFKIFSLQACESKALVSAFSSGVSGVDVIQDFYLS